MNRVSNTGIVRLKLKNNLEASLRVKLKVDEFIDQQILEWEAKVPYANHMEEKEIQSEWYTRHMIEHVWRIRLMRSAQTRVLHDITKISPEAAQSYARYQDEEMLHDKLFSQDLEKMGVDKETILETEPFLATRLLCGFMHFIAEHENPIGAICYSYLVEYTTIKLTPKQLEALSDSLGEDQIEGQKSHLNTDIVEDHLGDMWALINSLIITEDDEIMVIKYLEEFQYILAMYFKELHSVTILKNKRLSV